MDFEDLWSGPAPQLPAESFAKRRRRVADALGDDGVLLVATHEEVVFSNDVHHRFRPHNDFWYLTGFGEPEALAVLEGGTGKTSLFLRHRKPDAEVWTGRRLGVDRAPETLGVDAAYDWGELGLRLRDLTAGKQVHAITEHHAEAHEHLTNATAAMDGSDLVAGFRCIKDAQEIGMMREAARVGMAGMEAGLGAVRPGGTEAEAEAEILAAYRRLGSTGPSYPPIVGSGANASILHYIDNQGPVRDGDLVLIDAGCEWGHYASDITRTVPANGAWTDLQGRLYDIVRDAQKAAIATVAPGRRIKEVHDAAVEVLVAGLVDLGYLDDVDKALADHTYRRFYMHGTSHFLGLDVHDVGGLKDAEGKSRRLEPGMVITVEPGLYFNPDFAACPPEAEGIGIRIENDVVVTDDGHEDLQAGLAADRDVADLVRRG